MSRYAPRDPEGWLARCNAARYPVEPLVELLNERGGRTEADRAKMLKLSRKSWHRWRADGDLSDRQADMAACRLGLHPASVWPNFDGDDGT